MPRRKKVQVGQQSFCNSRSWATSFSGCALGTETKTASAIPSVVANTMSLDGDALATLTLSEEDVEEGSKVHRRSAPRVIFITHPFMWL